MLTRLLASDPGLNRLRAALQTVSAIGLAMLVEWGFVRLTGAMQIDTHGAILSATEQAAVDAQHHGVTVIAIIIGALVGMVTSFASGSFATPKAMVGGYLAIPICMIAGLTVGLALSSNRTVSLIMLVVVLSGGAYCRRFGPLGSFGGQATFQGSFFGFFLGGTLKFEDVGWLAAEIAIGAATALLAQFTLFYPGRRRALRRLQRSYAARRRDLIVHAIEMIDDAHVTARDQQQLQRRLVGLNETALMVDAHLNNPASLPPGWSAESLHQILFDIEMAVGTMGRLTSYLTQSPRLSAPTRARVRQALVAVRDDNIPAAEIAADRLLKRVQEAEDEQEEVRVVLHRFALSVLAHSGAQRRLRDARRIAAQGARADDVLGLDTPIVLAAGWLPGSALISAAASEEPDHEPEARGWRHVLLGHVALTPNVRVAIQMAVAVAACILIGELLSGRRFYWAVLAAFVSFLGANSATEQVRKGINRIIGTFIGVVLGALLVHWVGHHAWIAIVVILMSLFLGVYFLRVSYIFMVLGITVMISQLYVQLDEFSDSLLWLRLEETALGVAITAVTVLCVLPLRTGRVARLSSRRFLEAIDEVVLAASGILSGTGSEAELRTASRRMDDAYQTLITVNAALRRPLLDRGTNQRSRFLACATAARNYARNMLADVPATGPLTDEAIAILTQAQVRFSASLNVLVSWLDHGTSPDAYVRSASLFSQVGHGTTFGDPIDLTLRDLQLLDGALARMATTLGISLRALDNPDGDELSSASTPV